MSYSKQLFEAEQIARQRELNLCEDDYLYEQYLRERQWEELFHAERPEELKKYDHEKKN